MTWASYLLKLKIHFFYLHWLSFVIYLEEWKIDSPSDSPKTGNPKGKFDVIGNQSWEPNKMQDLAGIQK